MHGLAVAAVAAIIAGWNAVSRMLTRTLAESSESTDSNCEPSSNAREESLDEKIYELPLASETSSTTVSTEVEKEERAAVKKDKRKRRNTRKTGKVEQVNVHPLTPLQPEAVSIILPTDKHSYTSGYARALAASQNKIVPLATAQQKLASIIGSNDVAKRTYTSIEMRTIAESLNESFELILPKSIAKKISRGSVKSTVCPRNARSGEISNDKVLPLTPLQPKAASIIVSAEVAKRAYTSGEMRAIAESQNEATKSLAKSISRVPVNQRVLKCAKSTTVRKQTVADCPQIASRLQLNQDITPSLWNPHHIDELDRVICQSFDREKISPMRRFDLNMELSRLHAAIKQHLFNKGHPMAHFFRLEVFGSTENGFGSVRSDMDVCFHYGVPFTPVGYQRTKMQRNAIHDFASALRNSKGFTEVIAIPTAKVPIVKFKTAASSGDVEGDISYYNQLALYNTRLLKQYCSWTKDETLSKLGMFVKRWAKQCEIKDASNGSLSSYAYNLLVIHFLQRLQPHPLLPVLQEMGNKKEIRVDGCDVYFCDDEPKPNWSQCKLSVGELFLQFLDYYANFNWDTEVVQIRQTKVLTKREIGWTKKICIQDPFELNHNLGHGVRDHMFEFIKKSFAASREVFCSLKERDNFYRRLGGNKEECDLPIADAFISSYGNVLLSACRIGNTPQYIWPNRR